MEYQAVSLAERPELLVPALELHAVAGRSLCSTTRRPSATRPAWPGSLAAFQVLLLDEKDELAAAG
jgi:hypothetical protein